MPVVITNLMEREQYQVWRKRNRVRLIDVSQYCNCSESLISRWENGKTNIDDVIFENYNEYIRQYEKNNKWRLNYDS